jgi:hypothetical protein
MILFAWRPTSRHYITRGDVYDCSFKPLELLKSLAAGGNAACLVEKRQNIMHLYPRCIPLSFLLLVSLTGVVECVVFGSATAPDQARSCLLKAFKGGVRDKKVYSQKGEDGILETIFECIGATSRYYVEFGVETGSECTTRNLREHHNFTGLLMDGSNENPSINLHKERIFSHNVAGLLKKYNVPMPVFDQLTVDLDQNTFWLVHSVLSSGYRPRSLTVEFNRNFAWNDSYVTIDMPDEMAFTNDAQSAPSGGPGVVSNCYFGASAKAFMALGKSFGYNFVAADQDGINLFFVHSSVIGGQHLFSLEDAKQLFSRGGEYRAIHPPCLRHVWLEVPMNANFASTSFHASQLPLVLLSYTPGPNNQRVFYRVKFDEHVLLGSRVPGTSVGRSHEVGINSGVTLTPFMLLVFALLPFAAGVSFHRFGAVALRRRAVARRGMQPQPI